MSELDEEIITVGIYVIVKKQNYSKVYKVTSNGNVMLGKDQVNMSEIIGKPFWSTFEMITSKKGKRAFDLKEVSHAESWTDLKNSIPSGPDNRSITDDGTSQKLSKEEILELQESGKSGKEIVGSLIENSKSFASKTEYSQEKYIKKKEKKYFRFITICKPTITALHEIYFRNDHARIANLRIDTLAQFLSYSDVQSDGVFLLYDSGANGLPAAAMLNRIGANTNGVLVNLHPGNFPQLTAVHAMNFPKEQMDRLLSANIYSFLRLHYQGSIDVPSNSIISDITVNSKEDNKTEMSNNDDEKTDNIDSIDVPEGNGKTEDKKAISNDVSEELPKENELRLKRKQENTDEIQSAKKQKWVTETQNALDVLKDRKARGLAIVAKEHPLNIIKALLPFLGISRPFVIHHTCREPLQETYFALKQKQGVVNLKLYTNFLRSYQVLPERTHPDIQTSDTGGYILTGYFVEP